MTETNSDNNLPRPHVASTVGKPSPSGKVETATLAAGCFWTVEAVNRGLEGVLETKCGFMGGNGSNPSYEEVYTDKTGHAEVVEVQFDPEMITFDQLLDAFWHNHNPTQADGQGEDIGTRYRSEIFYHDDAQKQAAEASLTAFDQSSKFDKPVATKITPASEFYSAEEYHQRYFEKNGISACGVNLKPAD